MGHSVMDAYGPESGLRITGFVAPNMEPVISNVEAADVCMEQKPWDIDSKCMYVG